MGATKQDNELTSGSATTGNQHYRLENLRLTNWFSQRRKEKKIFTKNGTVSSQIFLSPFFFLCGICFQRKIFFTQKKKSLFSFWTQNFEPPISAHRGAIYSERMGMNLVSTNVGSSLPRTFWEFSQKWEETNCSSISDSFPNGLY